MLREVIVKRKILYKIGQILSLLVVPLLVAWAIYDTVVATAFYFWRELKWNLRMEVYNPVRVTIRNILK